MCQEIHVSDVRSALLDLSDENDDEPLPPVDLLTRFDDWLDDHFAHAFDHRRRARELALSGDEDGAAIHKALLANMTRAAG